MSYVVKYHIKLDNKLANKIEYKELNPQIRNFILAVLRFYWFSSVAAASRFESNPQETKNSFEPETTSGRSF